MEPVVLVSYVALWVVVVFQGLLLLGLVRAVAELSASGRRSGGLGVPNTARLGTGQPSPGARTGERAPHFNAVDALGGRVDSASFDGQPRLLVFVAPSWALQEHEARRDSMIFTYSDRAAQEKLGLFRESLEQASAA